jgi:hypothetical protein
MLNLSNSVTPQSRTRLEKLINRSGGQGIVRHFGIRRFIAVFKSLSLYPVLNQLNALISHPVSWRSTSVLSSHVCLCLPYSLFLAGFPTTVFIWVSHFPHACYTRTFPPVSSVLIWLSCNIHEFKLWNSFLFNSRLFPSQLKRSKLLKKFPVGR